MPKPNKQRGRRMKRKLEDDPDDPAVESSSKRRKSVDAEAEQQFLPLDVQDEDMSAAYPNEKAFFGMLDETEQEYFRLADEKLESNEFDSAEERAKFIENVYREADGKELKIAHSQSSSRFLERLIRISSAAQLKNLFQKFSGNFVNLITHRFASHVSETLFTCAAPFVSQELREPVAEASSSKNVNEVYVSMENLFLYTVAELEGNVGFLLTDQYASHALRVLLLILAGKPISTEAMKGILQSKRKEGSSARAGSKASADPTAKDRPVPDSFSQALEKLISDSVAGLDTDKLRALATHNNANPILQLLLTLELSHYGKQRAKDESSIIRTLLPDEPFTADCESAAFIGGMVYDPIGSHLVEKIIESAPAKLFKSLYFNFFKDRLASYARHETGTYVVCTLIERLGYDDLLEAHEILCPVLPSLLEKHWTSLTRTLIDRCKHRDIDTQAIAVVIEETFGGPQGFDLLKMLKVDTTPHASDAQLAHANGNPNPDVTTFFSRPDQGSKVHFNILAQGMLIVPGSLSALILDSMILLETTTLVKMAKDYIATRTLQEALSTANSSMIQRRKLVQRFYGNIGDMALDKSASHVVDHIWQGTHGLAFIRERIAEELAENEAMLRESASGRAVWKNWKMDIYKRKRQEWIRQSKIKASNDGFQSFSELDARKKGDGAQKTPLQIARERHVREKAQKTERAEKARKAEDAEKAKAADAEHMHADRAGQMSVVEKAVKERKEKRERKAKKEGKEKSEKSGSARRSSRSSNSVVTGPARTPTAAAT